MANAPTSPGDFTGRQKAKLQEKAQREQAEAAERMSMVTAEKQRSASREVVDYTKQAKPEPVDTGPVDYTVPAEEREQAEAGDPTIDAIVARSGEGTAEEAAGFPPAEVAPQPVQPTQVEKTSVLVRARYDLENVTIGHGNHYDFEAGRQYRLPANAAEHLAERDYVDILQ